MFAFSHTQTPHPRDTKHPYTHQFESWQRSAPLLLLSNIWDLYAWWAMSHSSVLFFCSLQFCWRYFSSDSTQERAIRPWTDRQPWNLSLPLSFRSWDCWQPHFNPTVGVQKSNTNVVLKKEPVKRSVYITQTYTLPSQTALFSRDR